MTNQDQDLTKLMRIRVAELCPEVFEIHETWRNHRLEQYATCKNDGHLLEIDPTADLNACRELIDLLAEKGWTCQLDNGLDKTWECTFETGTSGHKDYKTHYAAADTLAVAICRAFVALHDADSGGKSNE